MPHFGPGSRTKLDQCHPDLVRVMNRAILLTDFSVICGYRGQEAQEQAYNAGNSDAQWPDSNHNVMPSNATDVAPWPIDWNDEKAFHYMAGVIMACADAEGVKLRWGGTFKNIADLGHFERVPYTDPLITGKNA